MNILKLKPMLYTWILPRLSTEFLTTSFFEDLENWHSWRSLVVNLISVKDSNLSILTVLFCIGGTTKKYSWATPIFLPYISIFFQQSMPPMLFYLLMALNATNWFRAMWLGKASTWPQFYLENGICFCDASNLCIYLLIQIFLPLT